MPSFCRLEVWNVASGDWVVAHAGIALLHPQRYVERLAAKGKAARVILVDTDEVLYGDELAGLL